MWTDRISKNSRWILGKMLRSPLGLAQFLDRLGRIQEYRSTVTVHPSARFLSGARVYNIRGTRDSIRIGAHTGILGELLTFAHGGSIEIGSWCYIGEGARIWSAERIRIGNRVLISHDVNIHDTNSHSLTASIRHRHFTQIITQGHPKKVEDIAASAVTIEDDVWIGFNSIVLKGVTIGARSVVAAGSIVINNIPRDSLFVGNQVINKSNHANHRKQ